MQDRKAFPRTIPGAVLGLNHFFIPKNDPSHQVFLPSVMVLKCDTTNTSNAAKQSAPYYLRSQSSSVDPEVTIGTKLAIDATKKDASSKQFLSEQNKAWDSIKSEQEELAKKREVEDRQRRQQKAQEELNLRDTSGIDVTMLDEEKQKKLYEEAQLKNKKQNINQAGGDYHTYGSQGNFSQTGGNNPQLDAVPGGNFGQQQSQHYAKQHEQGYLVGTHTNSHQSNPDRWYPVANQSNVIENYNVPTTRPAFQEQQPPAQPPISQYPSQMYGSQGYQPPVCQPQLQSPAQQMAHIPRAGEGENTTPVYFSSGGTQFDKYNDNQGHPHQRPKVYHNYDEIPGQPDQADHLNQQSQYSDPGEYPADYNPKNLEVGSMIQYGNPPRYGMIKWIGHLPRAVSLVAGVEMVSMHIIYMYNIYYHIFIVFHSQAKINSSLVRVSEKRSLIRA